MTHKINSAETKRFKMVTTSNDFTFKVDEWTSESQMRNECPTFFRTPHGKRESVIVHRGQIIVRNTVQFTGCKPERRTTVYLYVIEDSDRRPTHDMICISTNIHLNSVAQAKRFIDRVLDSGKVDG